MKWTLFLFNKKTNNIDFAVTTKNTAEYLGFLFQVSTELKRLKLSKDYEINYLNKKQDKIYNDVVKDSKPIKNTIPSGTLQEIGEILTKNNFVI